MLLLFAGFGWGRPVNINPARFTRKHSMETGEAIVAFAGPLMNFILAILFTIIYYVMLKYAPDTQLMVILINVVLYTASINIGLGVFNLIPLPPLDGEKIFRRILPYRAIEWLDSNANTLQLIFMILWITGLLAYIVSPVVNTLFIFLFSCIGTIFGVF